jgi:hypothetical protein
MKTTKHLTARQQIALILHCATDHARHASCRRYSADQRLRGWKLSPEEQDRLRAEHQQACDDETQAERLMAEARQMMAAMPADPTSDKPWAVGSVMSKSWGYEQTNIDYAIVVHETASTVTILPVENMTVGGHGSWVTEVVPNRDAVKAQPFVIRKNAYNRWHPWNGKALTATHYA